MGGWVGEEGLSAPRPACRHVETCSAAAVAGNEMQEMGQSKIWDSGDRVGGGGRGVDTLARTCQHPSMWSPARLPRFLRVYGWTLM